jgi:hypothetical protein
MSSSTASPARRPMGDQPARIPAGPPTRRWAEDDLPSAWPGAGAPSALCPAPFTAA